MVRELEGKTEAERLKLLNEAVEKMRSHERKELNVNIDEAWKEHSDKKKPFRFTLGEETYEVASSMPAKFTLFYLRNCLRELELNDKKVLVFDIPESKFEEFLVLMLGEKFAYALLKSEVSFDFINENIIKSITVGWGLMFDDDTPRASEDVGDDEKKDSTSAS